MNTSKSAALLQRAMELIPGGVNSPVRAFGAVQATPRFIERAKGASISDVDGNDYIDFVGSWGPLILGHAHDDIVAAIHTAASQGTSFGATTAREVELAAMVVEAVPSVERVRFVNSGTEATMSALRLARGFTGRDRLLKFSGCYHGHADAFLADAGSGVATLGIPGSEGVPEAATRDTITVPFNDLEAAHTAMKNHGASIAAIILEPIACNMGLVQPKKEFLLGLRRLCDEHGALLIFDEVICGFRVHLGGAQELFDIRPDLSTFGKIIGGGLPVGAYGGRRDIMEKVAPLGGVYQAGTLSGNPLAMAAGIATLKLLEAENFYRDLEAKADHFAERLRKRIKDEATLSRVGSVFHLWFKRGAQQAPQNYAEVKTADAERFKTFFSACLERGVYLAPSAFEVGFVSAAHSYADLDTAADAMGDALDACG